MRLKSAFILGLLLTALCSTLPVHARDLPDIRQEGVLRHLGVPYAHFVTGVGDGLDVEIIQRFAEYLGLEYRYVQTSWRDTFGALTGRNARYRDGKLRWLEASPIRGDVIGHGMTVLDWRKQVVDFSQPAFPTAVWLIARAESSMQPIAASGEREQDILAAKNRLDGRSLLGVSGTCADPDLYGLKAGNIDIRLVDGIKDPFLLVPEILGQRAESTLLDAPDVLLAMQRYPGRIKVIGPVSPPQTMAFAFRKNSPLLRAAFEAFFTQLKADGTYRRLVSKYYPSVFSHFPAFFADIPDDEKSTGL